MLTTIAKTHPMISTDTIPMMRLTTVIPISTQAITTTTPIHATITTATIIIITITITVTIGIIVAGSRAARRFIRPNPSVVGLDAKACAGGGYGALFLARQPLVVCGGWPL